MQPPLMRCFVDAHALWGQSFSWPRSSRCPELAVYCECIFIFISFKAAIVCVAGRCVLRDHQAERVGAEASSVCEEEGTPNWPRGRHPEGHRIAHRVLRARARQHGCLCGASKGPSGGATHRRTVHVQRASHLQHQGPPSPTIAFACTPTFYFNTPTFDSPFKHSYLPLSFQILSRTTHFLSFLMRSLICAQVFLFSNCSSCLHFSSSYLYIKSRSLAESLKVKIFVILLIILEYLYNLIEWKLA